MEQYTDDERVEDLKKWWKENGASILIGIALGVIAIFAWQYWTSYRNAQAETASRVYDAFVAAADKPDADPARQLGQTVITDFPKSPYAALTALRLAKLALDGNDPATATQRLEWVIAHAKLDELRDIARLRLAQVKLSAGQTAEAKKLLEDMTTATLAAEREELKGDLYLASNDLDQARTAYAASQAAGNSNRLLQLKLDNLALATPNTVIAAPTAPPPPPESPQKESAPPESASAVTPAEAAPATESAAEPAPAAPASEPATESAAPASEPAAEPAPAAPAPEPAAEPALAAPASVSVTEPAPAAPASEPAATPPASTSGQ